MKSQATATQITLEVFVGDTTCPRVPHNNKCKHFKDYYSLPPQTTRQQYDQPF